MAIGIITGASIDDAAMLDRFFKDFQLEVRADDVRGIAPTFWEDADAGDLLKVTLSDGTIEVYEFGNTAPIQTIDGQPEPPRYIPTPVPVADVVADGFYTFVAGTTQDLGAAFDDMEIGEFINGRSLDLPSVTINIDSYTALAPEFVAGTFQIVKESATELSFINQTQNAGGPNA